MEAEFDRYRANGPQGGGGRERLLEAGESPRRALRPGRPPKIWVAKPSRGPERNTNSGIAGREPSIHRPFTTDSENLVGSNLL